MKNQVKKTSASLLGVVLVSVSLVSSNVWAAPQRESTDNLFKESKKAFFQSDYDGALGFLGKYFSRLVSGPKEKARTKFRFFAIAAMGRILLQYKQDPQSAINWFEKVKKSQKLTVAEQDVIDGWITGAKEWQKLGKFPNSIKDSKDLFTLGKGFYESALKKQKYVMDPAGTADYSIAASYLVPFIAHNDKSADLGEALYMMGDIRRKLWSDNEYWSENYYLTEAIRRFPGTPLAMKAYQVLDEDVHFGYTGTSGDHTPHSWVVLLGELKQIAEAKDTTEKGSMDDVQKTTPQ